MKFEIHNIPIEARSAEFEKNTDGTYKILLKNIILSDGDNEYLANILIPRYDFASSTALKDETDSLYELTIIE